MSDEKNKYITAYGSSNADSYGRGDVTDISTKYSMLPTNPLSDENAPKINSYSSDGSYNQDIFGWKCFNSPVSFRNGIYGECGAVTTYTDQVGGVTNCGIKIFAYAQSGDVESKIVLSADHIKLDGAIDSLTADNANALVYSGNNVIHASSSSSVIPNSDNTVDLGSASYKFKDIHIAGTLYGDIKLINNLTFKTKYFGTNNTYSTSDAASTNLSGEVTVNLPKRTVITSPNTDGSVVAEAGCGDYASDGAYLAVNRVVPMPSYNQTVCYIGTEAKKYNDIWVSNVHGCIPTGNAANFPVGCIIMAMATISAFTNASTYQFGAGAVSSDTSNGEIFEGGWDPDLNNWSQVGTANLKSSNRVWRTLSGCTHGASSSSTKVPVLIMRIE